VAAPGTPPPQGGQTAGATAPCAMKRQHKADKATGK